MRLVRGPHWEGAVPPRYADGEALRAHPQPTTVSGGSRLRATTRTRSRHLQGNGEESRQPLSVCRGAWTWRYSSSRGTAYGPTHTTQECDKRATTRRHVAAIYRHDCSTRARRVVP